MLRVAEHSKATDTGRQRRTNEDSLFVRPPLFVLADGMGGAQAGEVASAAAVEVFRNGLPDGPGSSEERLAALVAEANSRVHALAHERAEHAGMGTTLTAAYLDDRDLAIAHVGDSRLYCLRDGELERRTDDHTLVEEMLRRGQLSPEEAERHPQKSIITRAVGPEHEVAIDHHTWAARPGDVFLLCSDGLTDMLSDDEVAQLLRSAASLKEAGRALVRAANDAGGRDNITVLLFRVEEVGAAPTPGEPATQVEQPTGSAPAVPAAAVAQAQAPAPASAPPARPRAPRVPVPAVPAVPPPRRRRRWAGPAKVLLVLAVLLAMVGSGAWIASRSVFFVGTSDDGFVALYQGLPYELPGVDLYTRQFESGVPVSALPPRVRARVTGQELRSEQDAVDLIRQLERGQVAGQR